MSNLNNNSNADMLDHVAIDFRELMRQEKRRVKEEKRRMKEQARQQRPPERELMRATTTTTTSQTQTATHTNYKINNNCEKEEDKEYWPLDWLSTFRSSEVPFVPDYYTTSDSTTSSSCRHLQSVLYKRHFLNDDQSTRLANWLYTLPETTTTTTTKMTTTTTTNAASGRNQGSDSTSSSSSLGTWKTLKFAKRRVLMFDETTSTMPLPLTQLAQVLVDVGIFPSCQRPNHVLINEYSSPSQGILPHTDGPSYSPKTATISIVGRGDDDEEEGSSSSSIAEVLLNFSKRLEPHEIGLVANPVVLQVLLHSGSLVVFEDDAYTNYCHSIQDVHVEYASNVCMNATEGTRVLRGKHRISLTFRHKNYPTNNNRADLI